MIENSILYTQTELIRQARGGFQCKDRIRHNVWMRAAGSAHRKLLAQLVHLTRAPSPSKDLINVHLTSARSLCKDFDKVPLTSAPISLNPHVKSFLKCCTCRTQCIDICIHMFLLWYCKIPSYNTQEWISIYSPFYAFLVLLFNCSDQTVELEGASSLPLIKRHHQWMSNFIF